VSSRDEDGAPVLERLLLGRLDFITGGLHKEEILRTPLGELLRELKLAGRLKEYGSEVIDSEASAVDHLIISNDRHIIGLALASQGRLLYSHDQPLTEDFTNQLVLKNPRGKVYKYASHRRLLDEACS
jgi:hypothetical protein